VAAAGYPQAARTGDRLTGAERPGVIHAGTALRDGRLVSAGGRVVACTAVGADLGAARRAAYELVEQVGLDGGQYRRDIARAAARGEVTVPG
jgi:phosphoribosylamine--glycine ligase